MTSDPHPAGFTLTSPDLVDGFGHAHLLSAAYNFGCDGGNRSPALQWSGAPEGAKSFVLRIFDKDAPTGMGFWHWIVVNIPADATGLEAGGGLPTGALETRTDFGVPGYAGPCPPVGETHAYEITLTALDVDALPLNGDVTPAIVGFMVNAHTVASTTLTVRSGR